jgi:hypothetical protein
MYCMTTMWVTVSSEMRCYPLNPPCYLLCHHKWVDWFSGTNEHSDFFCLKYATRTLHAHVVQLTGALNQLCSSLVVRYNETYCVIGNALLSPESTLLSFVSSQMSCYQLSPSFYLLQRLLNIFVVSSWRSSKQQ